MPSVTNLAFNLSLPLNVGPPPFQSRNARIRYVLYLSLLIRDQGRQYIVRISEDVTVLSVYDRKYIATDQAVGSNFTSREGADVVAQPVDCI